MANENEEFEFRLRAEQEAKVSLPPGKQNVTSGQLPIPQGQQVGNEELPGFADAAKMLKAIPGGAGQALEGIGNAVQHPIDAITGLAKKIPGALSTGADAIMHPIDTTQKVGDYLKNLKPEQAGATAGSMMVGGAAGKAAGVLGDVVGPSIKALQKPVSPTIRDLASKGVVTTPGMRGGKIASALEQRATSIPLVGDQIKRARGKATEQWNRSELNDAIKDAGGQEIPKGRKGRDAIAHTETEMGKAYTRVLSKMNGDLNSADPSGTTFRQFLDQSKQIATQGLEPSTAKVINNMIDNKVIAKFNQAGQASGERIKEIQETLRTEIDDLKAGNYQERKAAEALKQVSAEMKSMLKRENPKLATELDGIDRGYAKFKTSSKASLYATKNSGTYTPAQKLQAIRARDKSKDKQRFASGTAHGEKDAEAVESVIGNTEPDSGSAGRIATMEAILGGAGIAAHHPLGAAAVMGGPAMYSQPILKMLQNRALKKGGPYKPIGASAPIAGAAMGVDQNGVAQ
jgi:hypothetical protein